MKNCIIGLTIISILFLSGCGSIDQLVVDKVAGAIEKSLDEQEVAALSRFDAYFSDYGITFRDFDINNNMRIELGEINPLLKKVMSDAILPELIEIEHEKVIEIFKELLIFLALGPVSNEIQSYLETLQSPSTE